jgi:hypothetical protein
VHARGHPGPFSKSLRAQHGNSGVVGAVDGTPIVEPIVRAEPDIEPIVFAESDIEPIVCAESDIVARRVDVTKLESVASGSAPCEPAWGARRPILLLGRAALEISGSRLP